MLYDVYLQTILSVGRQNVCSYDVQFVCTVCKMLAYTMNIYLRREKKISRNTNVCSVRFKSIFKSVHIVFTCPCAYFPSRYLSALSAQYQDETPTTILYYRMCYHGQGRLQPDDI